jgi:hypothetical protein
MAHGTHGRTTHPAPRTSSWEPSSRRELRVSQSHNTQRRLLTVNQVSMAVLPRALNPYLLKQAVRTTASKRPFFASSTDYTRLLADSEVFRLEKDGHYLYALAAGGSDVDTVRNVPQLHLARLYVNLTAQEMWGAKVVNRTLGPPKDVCGKLVDAALEDTARPVRAKSTVHGLSDWVLNMIAALDDLDKEVPLGVRALLENKETVKEVTAVAQNQADAGENWELLAKEFILASEEGESALYPSMGATLVEIQHKADTTEFSNTCAGSIALFEFR